MATIVIPEQIVNTVKPVGDYPADAPIEATWPTSPTALLFTVNGNQYVFEEKIHAIPNQNTGFPRLVRYYGDYNFVECPFYVKISNEPILYTKEPGEYVISAVVAEEKSPIILSFPKGRTIVSELSRINKAFGTISKKKTIIGQLSDIADAAEAGRIGGGSGGALMVHENSNALDKTWQEIHDALKTTSVCIITGNNDEKMLVGTEHRITLAYYSNNKYRVRTDNSKEFTTDSSDGYPKSGAPK